HTDRCRICWFAGCLSSVSPRCCPETAHVATSTSSYRFRVNQDLSLLPVSRDSSRAAAGLIVSERHGGVYMAVTRRELFKVSAAALVAGVVAPVSIAADDALPSWNDGPAKKAILDFVHSTTDRMSSKFVPDAERIATFDQDGTLWVEHPMYTQ